MLGAYFDGSRTNGHSLTLSAVAADMKLWESLEDQWKYVLKDRGGAPYMHMKEAMPLKESFATWVPSNRDFLLNGLIALLAEFSHKPRFAFFTCTVDLEAHRRLRKIKYIPPPERLCSRIVFPKLLDWYGAFSDPILDVIEVYFDRNEKFIGHIQRDWENKKIRRENPVWDLIRTIAPADMRITPPLQVADMIAWSRNRLAAPIAGANPLVIKPSVTVKDYFSVLARRIIHGQLPDHNVDVTEQIMATQEYAR